MPERARVLFLPQRAYLPIASLRDAVSYPAPGGTFDDASIREILTQVGLDGLQEHLDEVQNWSIRLSGGEQQRLAIARALLHRPDWLFLDEATAALDEGAEQRMYELMSQRLPDSAIVSIAHRPGVAAFHDTQLKLQQDGLHALTEVRPVGTTS
jgi:putative ATP-binding cassette transporter